MDRRDIISNGNDDIKDDVGSNPSSVDHKTVLPADKTVLPADKTVLPADKTVLPANNLTNDVIENISADDITDAFLVDADRNSNNNNCNNNNNSTHMEMKEMPADHAIDLDDADDKAEEEEGDGDARETKCSLCAQFYRCRQSLQRWCVKRHRLLTIVVSLMCIALYLTYFCYAMYLHYDDGSATGLIVVTAILLVVVLAKSLPEEGPASKFHKLLLRHPRALRHVKRLVAVLSVVTTCVTLVTEVILVRPSNLISLCGIAGIVFVFLITSTHPHRVIWRPVISGLILQYLFALAILRVPFVHATFRWIGQVINLILHFSKEGSQFLFGPDFNYSGFVFHLLPLVAFVLCLLTVLEHLRVLHFILTVVGRFLAACIGASPAETLNASANIFMGPVDSLVIIRPYLKDITSSQIHCLMSNGMATVTGSIMGLFIMLGISADHLLAASVMSAPAALAIAKLAVPETRVGARASLSGVHIVSKYRSLMDAFSSGALSSMPLVASIVANVTAVVSFMKMVNTTLTWLGDLVGVRNLTLQWICSYLFYPLALGIGSEIKDAHRVAELLGVKAFINEIVAYTTLGIYRRNRHRFEDYVSQNFTDWSVDPRTNDVTLHAWNVTLPGGFLTERSEVISTYALCGFANFISVGVIMGCYLVLVPHRKQAVFRYVLRSMLVGHAASLLTACIAGLLYR